MQFLLDSHPDVDDGHSFNRKSRKNDSLRRGDKLQLSLADDTIMNPDAQMHQSDETSRLSVSTSTDYRHFAARGDHDEERYLDVDTHLEQDMGATEAGAITNSYQTADDDSEEEEEFMLNHTLSHTNEVPSFNT